jgi:hypothetical protein
MEALAPECGCIVRATAHAAHILLGTPPRANGRNTTMETKAESDAGAKVGEMGPGREEGALRKVSIG